jgi:hypothetical protein
VLGTASIGTLVVNQTVLSTGSNQLGDSANDTQTLYGTVVIPTGSLTVSGSARISGDIDTSGSIVSTNTFTNLGNFSTGIGLSKTTNNSSILYSDIVSIQGTARSYNNFAYRVYGVKGIGGTDGGFSAQSIDTVTGVQGFISIGNGNKSVTSVMSLYGAASIVGTGNTVTNYYGLFLETPVGSTITNNWGVYQQSTGSKNYFGGNVGIGTLTPSYLLDVNGTSRLNGVAQISSINLGVSNNSQLADLSGVMELKGYNGFSLKAWQSGWGSGTTAVTITTDGKVGIGNTAPDYPLHITRNSTNNYIQLSGNTSKGIFAEGSGLLAFDTAGNLSIYTGGVNLRATFSSTGNLGIGTSTPSASLHIKGTTTSSLSSSLLIENSGSTYSFRIKDNGDLAATSNYITISSYDTTINGGNNVTINGASFNPGYVYRSATNGFISLANDGTVASSIALFGSTHATLPNLIRVTAPSGIQITGSLTMSGSLEVKVNSASSTNNALRLSNTQGNAGIGTGLVFYSDTTPSQGVFNTGRIYSDFPGFLYTDARMIFQTPTADSTWTDTLTL